MFVIHRHLTLISGMILLLFSHIHVQTYIGHCHDTIVGYVINLHSKNYCSLTKVETGVLHTSVSKGSNLIVLSV